MLSRLRVFRAVFVLSSLRVVVLLMPILGKSKRAQTAENQG
jgi:hypothetical protein